MKLYPASRRRGPNECENCRREFVAKPKRTCRGEKVDFVCPYCGFDNTPAYGRMAKAHGYDAALFDRLREPGHILTAVLGWLSAASLVALFVLHLVLPAPIAPAAVPPDRPTMARASNQPQGPGIPSPVTLAATKTKPAPAAPVTRVHHDSKPEPTAVRALPRLQGQRRAESGISPASLGVLYHALRHVECGDVQNPPLGDNGAALGVYQIHRSYWLDARMPYGRYEDCRDRAYSEDVMAHYWARWCPQALVEVAWGILANTHHIGGPAARRGEWDAEYVERVRTEMETLQ